MPVNDKTPQWRHQLTLVDREEMTVEGVMSLGSADEVEIVMETERGLLAIKGEGLNIQQLNLEKGNIVVTAQTQLFLGDHFEIKAVDANENEWLIHSTNGVKLGERVGLFFDPEDIHVMRLNESQEDFDARIEKYEGDENEN